MQIIHIILGKANPNRMNGVNKVVWQLASHQFNAGTNVQVWGLTKTPEKQDFITPFPLQLFKENKFGVPEGLKEAVLSNAKTDTVFHFHGGFILSFFFIAKLLVNLGYNYVLTPHGAFNTVAMERSWLRKKIYFFLFERFLVTHAGFVQAVGKSEIDGLSNIESNVKQVLIPNGYVIEHQPRSLTKANDKFIIAYCGRLDAHTKGIDLMLESMQMLKEINTHRMPFQLWLIGDGEDRKQITEEIKRKKIEDIVVLKGAQYGQDKIDLLQQAHLFLHPSRNEGMPTGVQEAASLGLPLVISEETNLGSYVAEHDAGWVLSENNSTNQAMAISKAMLLHHNNVLSKKAENAITMVSSEFNWAPIAQSLLQEYQQLLPHFQTV